MNKLDPPFPRESRPASHRTQLVFGIGLAEGAAVGALTLGWPMAALKAGASLTESNLQLIIVFSWIISFLLAVRFSNSTKKSDDKLYSKIRFMCGFIACILLYSIVSLFSRI